MYSQVPSNASGTSMPTNSFLLPEAPAPSKEDKTTLENFANVSGIFYLASQNQAATISNIVDEIPLTASLFNGTPNNASSIAWLAYNKEFALIYRLFNKNLILATHLESHVDGKNTVAMLVERAQWDLLLRLQNANLISSTAYFSCDTNSQHQIQLSAFKIALKNAPKKIFDLILDFCEKQLAEEIRNQHHQGVELWLRYFCNRLTLTKLKLAFEYLTQYHPKHNQSFDTKMSLVFSFLPYCTSAMTEKRDYINQLVRAQMMLADSAETIDQLSNWFTAPDNVKSLKRYFSDTHAWEQFESERITLLNQAQTNIAEAHLVDKVRPVQRI